MPNDKEFELDDLESFSFDDLSLDDIPAPKAPEGQEDPFGVWVKSAPGEPEPLEPVAAAQADALPEEDFLSSEELASLDDSFDFVTVSEEPLEGENPLDDEIGPVDPPQAGTGKPKTDSFDEVSLDDFVSFDETTGEETPVFARDSAPAESPVEEDLNEDFLDIDIEIEDDIGDDELEIIEGAQRSAGASNDFGLDEVGLDSFTAQEVDLSEFGDFEEISAMDEDLDPGAKAPGDVELADFAGPNEQELFDDVVLDTPLAALEAEESVPLDLEPDDQTDLDHILALEEDLTSGIRSPEPTAPPTPPPSPTATPGAASATDLAALIMGKLEQELSSIKQEISALKQEVNNLRSTPELSVPEPSPDVSPEPEGATQPHGFFDEEDDETIALTGDELDNILSTAEISEGEEPGVSLDEDLLDLDEAGNLVEPADTVEKPADVLHVTDEEFLSGTALDLNEPDPLNDDLDLGIPDSIELEDQLPESLEEDATVDLLTPSLEDEFEVSPLPDGLLEGEPEPLEIPFDEDIALDIDDAAPLAPEVSHFVAESEGLEEALPEMEDLPPLEDAVWTPAAEEVVEEAFEEIDLSVDLEPPSPAPVLPPTPAPVSAPSAPPVPVPTPGVAPSGAIPSSMKDELKAVLQYMDKLLASLPDDKIQEFAESEHFEVYKRLFEELGLIE